MSFLLLGEYPTNVFCFRQNTENISIGNTNVSGDIILKNEGSSTNDLINTRVEANRVLLTNSGTGQNAVIDDIPVSENINIFNINTSENTTYTVGQILNSSISRDCTNFDRQDTFPTSAQIVAGIANCQVNSSFKCTIKNTGTFNTLTFNFSDLAISDDNTTIEYGYSIQFIFIVTNTGGGTEAVDVQIERHTQSNRDITYSFRNSYIGTNDYPYAANTILNTLTFPFNRPADGSGASDAWSFSMWIRQETISTLSQTNYLLSFGDAAGSYIDLFVASIDKSLNFKYGDQSLSGLGFLYYKTGTVIKYDTWQHILVTYNGTSTASDNSQFKIFVDGVDEPITPQASSTGYSGIINFANISIGGSYITGPGLNAFRGSIDEIAIWDTDQQSNIETIYNNGVIKNYDSLLDKPTDYWRVTDTDKRDFPKVSPKIGNYDLTLTNPGAISVDFNSDNFVKQAYPPSKYNDIAYLTYDNSTHYLSADPSGVVTFPIKRTTNGDGIEWSISFWFKPDATSGRILSIRDSANSTGIGINYVQPDHRLLLYAGSSSLSNDLIAISTNDDIVVEGKWDLFNVIFIGGVTGGSGAPASTYTSSFNIIKSGLILNKISSKIDDGWITNSFSPDAFELGTSTISPTNSGIDEVSIYNYDITDISGIMYNKGSPINLTRLYNKPISWWSDGITSTGDNIDTVFDMFGVMNLTSNGFTKSASLGFDVPGFVTYSSDWSLDVGSGNELVANVLLLLPGVTFCMNRPDNNPGNGQWTVSLWIKQISATATDQIIFKASTPLDDIVLLTYKPNDSLFFRYGTSTDFVAKQTAAGSVSTNTWHNIMIVYHGGTTGNDPANLSQYYFEIRIYIDGVQQTSGVTETNGNNGFVDPINCMNIQFSDNSNPFEGLIDDMSIHDNNLENQKSLIYNGGTPSNLYISQYPEHWWQLDRNTDNLISNSERFKDVIAGLNLNNTAITYSDYKTDVAI